MNYNERAELQKLSFIWQQDRRWVLQGRFDRKGMFGLGWLDNQDLKQQRERVIPWGENSIIQVMETHDKLKENLIIQFGLSAECFRRNEQDRVGGGLGTYGRSTTIFLIIMSSLKVLSMFCRHSECLETRILGSCPLCSGFLGETSLQLLGVKSRLCPSLQLCREDKPRDTEAPIQTS